MVEVYKVELSFKVVLSARKAYSKKRYVYGEVQKNTKALYVADSLDKLNEIIEKNIEKVTKTRNLGFFNIYRWEYNGRDIEILDVELIDKYYKVVNPTIDELKDELTYQEFIAVVKQTYNNIETIFNIDIN